MRMEEAGRPVVPPALLANGMDTVTADPKVIKVERPGIEEAWQMASQQLRMEMRRVDYETWVAPLRPLGFYDGVYRLGAYNRYGLDWVESRLRSRITSLLEGILQQPIQLKFGIIGSTAEPPAIDLPAPSDAPAVEPTSAVTAEAPPAPANVAAERKKRADAAPLGEGGSARKVQLQRAYGTERARIVQPERGMFLTNYLFVHWLPLLGHSAFAAILAARSLCYWNPMTGELRNIIETDMSELARRANISLRTIKEVLNNDLVRRYFLRYKIRRMMTSNGVRTAGILLQVRMDDPLTPEDQVAHNLPEEEHWYTIDVEDEEG